LSTSTRHREVVCNTTPIRIFAVVGQFDLLVDAVDGSVRMPREVLDPEEDPDLPEALLSEVGRAERHFAKRSRDPEALERRQRLAALRRRADIQVVDLSDAELDRKAQLTSRSTARTHGLAAPLGAGEAAVMALAEGRGWAAVIDDAAARRVLAEIAPGVAVMTSRELLVRAVTESDLLDSAEAMLIYADLLAAGYRGPAGLFGMR
jgi:predicted nucleic acid-binding protein